MGIKLYDGLSSTVARSLATSDPAVNVRLDGAAPPAADTVFIADGVGAGTWGAPPAGELPEILAAIALATPPSAAGQAPLYDGAGITWAAAGSGGPVLTGNPFIDVWGTPTAADDEFDGGSDDMAERGWTVYNRATGAPMTRGGGITYPSAPTDPSQYRSTRIGSSMAIQVHANGVICVKNAAFGIDTSYAIRVGIPRGRAVSTGNDPATVLSGSVQVGIIRSKATASTFPKTSGNFHRILFGQRPGANPVYGYEQSDYAYQREPTDQYSPGVLANVSGIFAFVGSDGVPRDSAFVDTESGSVRATHQQGFGGELSIAPTTQVGFDLFASEAAGPLCLFVIDYFRVRAGGSFYGL